MSNPLKKRHYCLYKKQAIRRKTNEWDENNPFIPRNIKHWACSVNAVLVCVVWWCSYNDSPLRIYLCDQITSHLNSWWQNIPLIVLHAKLLCMNPLKILTPYLLLGEHFYPQSLNEKSVNDNICIFELSSLRGFLQYTFCRMKIIPSKKALFFKYEEELYIFINSLWT